MPQYKKNMLLVIHSNNLIFQQNLFSTYRTYNVIPFSTISKLFGKYFIFANFLYYLVYTILYENFNYWKQW